ncbi:MAG TPA: hypothetical protein VGM05_33580 [Planctomycetaceae bacterium]
MITVEPFDESAVFMPAFRQTMPGRNLFGMGGQMLETERLTAQRLVKLGWGRGGQRVPPSLEILASALVPRPNRKRYATSGLRSFQERRVDGKT